MPKIRDLGINMIPDTMRPPEADDRFVSTSSCLPGTLLNAARAALTEEEIELLKRQLYL